jgi:hypothetical protein
MPAARRAQAPKPAGTRLPRGPNNRSIGRRAGPRRPAIVEPAACRDIAPDAPGFCRSPCWPRCCWGGPRPPRSTSRSRPRRSRRRRPLPGGQIPPPRRLCNGGQRREKRRHRQEAASKRPNANPIARRTPVVPRSMPVGRITPGTSAAASSLAPISRCRSGRRRCSVPTPATCRRRSPGPRRPGRRRPGTAITPRRGGLRRGNGRIFHAAIRLGRAGGSARASGW